MFRKTTSLKRSFHDSDTQYELTSVLPVPKTERIPAIVTNKTKKFCDVMNWVIRNFAVLTIQFGEDSYKVVHLSSPDINHIDVYFMDFGGKVWCTRVSSWNAFSIFRGV